MRGDGDLPCRIIGRGLAPPRAGRPPDESDRLNERRPELERRDQCGPESDSARIGSIRLSVSHRENPEPQPISRIASLEHALPADCRSPGSYAQPGPAPLRRRGLAAIRIGGRAAAGGQTLSRHDPFAESGRRRASTAPRQTTTQRRARRPSEKSRKLSSTPMAISPRSPRAGPSLPAELGMADGNPTPPPRPAPRRSGFRRRRPEPGHGGDGASGAGDIGRGGFQEGVTVTGGPRAATHERPPCCKTTDPNGFGSIRHHAFPDQRESS